jgi:hypothetical protein
VAITSRGQRVPPCIKVNFQLQLQVAFYVLA